jgi:hypothetical protein
MVHQCLWCFIYQDYTDTCLWCGCEMLQAVEDEDYQENGCFRVISLIETKAQKRYKTR